ncbi:MAG: hypothetical protein ACE5E8_10785 [Acidimicrobiia bacterium]
MEIDFNFDPYRKCEKHCNHDLARGVTLEDLLGRDGPFPTSSSLKPVRGISALVAASAGRAR